MECAFCKGILMNWKAGDDPEHAHKLNFPNCDFYMRETKDGTLLFHIITLIRIINIQFYLKTKCVILYLHIIVQSLIA